jgi:hypothetical protein
MWQKLFINFLTIFISTEVCASPWNIEVGENKNFATYRYYSTNQYFDLHGNKQRKNSDFSKKELQFLSEYGVSRNWNIGFNLFGNNQIDSNSDKTNYELTGISRTDLFARRQLYRGNDYAISSQMSVSLPAYYINKNADGRVLYERTAAELALFAGYNFEMLNQNHWLASKIAYRHRTGVFDDQYLLSAQMGLRAHEKLAIIPEINITQSAKEIDQPLNSIAGDNNYNLTNAQISVAYNLTDNVSLQLGVFQHVAGRNAGAGGGGFLSLWLEL